MSTLPRSLHFDLLRVKVRLRVYLGTNPFTVHLLHARPCAEHFTQIQSVNLYNSLMRWYSYPHLHMYHLIY